VFQGEEGPSILSATRSLSLCQLWWYGMRFTI